MEDYQNILFPYAYNILGSSDDARDAIQDVVSNYFSTKKENIENVKGYLIKGVINQSINIKKKKKNVRYEDTWLPEPIATEEADTNLNLREIASYSLLILLEKLNPKERAVFILKEGFGYSHDEIADVLSSTVDNSRKLLSRAKSKLDQPGKDIPAKHKQTPLTGLLEKYIDAVRNSDMKKLENLLSEDIIYFADGGDTVQVAKKVCTGLKNVCEHLVFVHHKYQTTLSILSSEVNHQPALLYYLGKKLVVCYVFSISQADNKIVQISSILDPEKLKGIQRG